MSKTTLSETLIKARTYQFEHKNDVPMEQKPKFHVTPPMGWSNDPNGFSQYQGKYHLFFQHHMYSTGFGPMHWGHAVSDDLIRWEYIDTALAPDTPADFSGIFSGSGLEVDGKHVLMYTGVQLHVKDEEARRMLERPEHDFTVFMQLRKENRIFFQQVQCMAEGDGRDYVKFPENPVISTEMLPEGMDPENFRDPKIWRGEDGVFYAVIGSCDMEHDAKLLLYSSEDLHSWKFVSIFHDNKKELGTMWECPDFFFLDGKAVIMASPEQMKGDNVHFPNRSSSACAIGSVCEETHTFVKESLSLIDHGVDYYAPTSMEDAKGRRIQIGWMGNFQNRITPESYQWIGGMTLPRELHIRDGKLYQLPVEELSNYYANKVEKTISVCSEEMQIEGISGRYLDMTVRVKGGDYTSCFVSVLGDQDGKAVITCDREKKLLSMDRSSCHFVNDHEPVTYAPLEEVDGELELRIVIDNAYVEVYLNQGAQVMSNLVFKAEGGLDQISFGAEGSCEMTIVKHDLVMK